jgi:hypothetical protein
VLAYLLYGSDLSGVSHLTPYVEWLAKRGRLLFLYDGLNEIDSLADREGTHRLNAAGWLVMMGWRKQVPAFSALPFSALKRIPAIVPPA